MDAVFLCVKAHGLPPLAAQLAPVLGPETAVVSTQNGIPWWYFQSDAGPLAGTRLERVDPGGVVSQAIEARRVVGSLIYFSTEIAEPGVVRHNEGNRISLGEPDGARTERIRKIADALIASGLRAPVTAHLRNEIWVKILGNVAFNPISALTGATLAQMLANHGNYGTDSQHHAGDGNADGKAGREDAGLDRAAHGGSSQGGRTQDLDAPGPGSRTDRWNLKQSSARCWRWENGSAFPCRTRALFTLVLNCWPSAGARRR